MSEQGTKSCIVEIVKTMAAIAAQLDAHSVAFIKYVEEERNIHNKIDAAIILLRTRLDTFIMRVGAGIIILLLGIVGFLLVKVMGW